MSIEPSRFSRARPWFSILRACVGAGLMLVGAIQAPAAPLAIGERFPDLGKYGLEGTLPDTSKARVVIVDFWASWCTPCRAAFPVLDGIQSEFGARGVQVVAISVDENRGAMEVFLKKRPVSFAVLRDAAMKLVGQVDVPTMPTTFVLDASGTVRFMHSGFRGEETRAELREQVTQLLEEQS